MKKDIVILSGSYQKSIKDIQGVLNSVMSFRHIEDKPNRVRVVKNKRRKKNPRKTNYKNKKNKW